MLATSYGRLFLWLTFIFVPLSSYADDNAEWQRHADNFVAAWNTGDPANVAALFDETAFTYQAAKTMFSDPADRGHFVQSIARNSDGDLIAAILKPSMIQKSSAKYMRNLKVEGKVRPLVRIVIASGGFDYFELIYKDSGARGQQLVDVYLASSGRTLSESYGAAGQLLVNPSKDLFERLFGELSVNEELFTQFQEIGKYRMAGNNAEAYAMIQKLPEKVKAHRVVITLATFVSQQVDLQTYSSQLARLAKSHGGEDWAALLLLDYYFMVGQLDSADATVDLLMAKYGEDANLYNLKANLAFTAGDPHSAVGYSRKAMSLEKDFLMASITLIGLLNFQRQYAELVEELKHFETLTQREFSLADFSEDETYVNFVESKEFKAWML